MEYSEYSSAIKKKKSEILAFLTKCMDFKSITPNWQRDKMVE